MAEIHRASKDGHLYDVGGGPSSCSAPAEPPEPPEHGALPASQVHPVSSAPAPRPEQRRSPRSSWQHSPDPCSPLLWSPRSTSLTSPTPTPRPAQALPATPGPASERWRACGQQRLSSSQLKPKRVGAGFPKGSCLFQTATELMEKTWVPEQEPRPEEGGEQGAPSRPCDHQGAECAEPLPGPRGEAPGSGAVCLGPSLEEERGPARGSPTAKARVNKKQQLLAAAALKDSQNIARFFCRKTKSPPLLTAAPGADSTSPSHDGARGPPMLLEKGSGQEDGAVGHGAMGRLAAPPETKECAEEGPR